MKDYIKNPFSSYHDSIPDVVSRFFFDHAMAVDSTGIIDTPEGFARPFYHKPTNTVGLLFSKTSLNLQGKRRQDGRLCGTDKEFEKCYIIGARRCKGTPDMKHTDRQDYHSNRRALRDSLEEFCDELLKRNQKHFTLFGAEAANFHPALRRYAINTNTKTEIFTNGRLAYLLDKKKSGRYEVTFLAPTRRKDGSFIPVDLDESEVLRSFFSKVSRTIARSDTYKGARAALMDHWGLVSSKLWDEKNLYEGEGNIFKGKKYLADIFNISADHMGMLLSTTLLIGGATALIKPELGLFGGVTATIAHTAAHIAIEKSQEGLYHRREKVKESEKKLEIDAYGFHVDVSDHFKLQTPENITKLCPHMDLQRFDPGDFELLDNSHFSLLRDRESLVENPEFGLLSRHLLFLHQRGFSSHCSVLDRRTRLDMFQSGIVRLLHEKKSGNIVVFAQYRPDLCQTEHLRLPEHYIERFKDGIVRIEYDRRAKDFSEGLAGRFENVTYEQAIFEIERDFLFSTQGEVPWGVRSKSERAVQDSFVRTSLSRPANTIRNRPPALPKMTALSF